MFCGWVTRDLVSVVSVQPSPPPPRMEQVDELETRSGQWLEGGPCAPGPHAVFCPSSRRDQWARVRLHAIAWLMTA